MCTEHTEKRCDANQAASKSARLFIAAVRGYQQYLSPLKSGPSCRFEPSCSAYAITALQRHGAIKGLILTVVRLAKCGPWHPGGFDPVPGKRPKLRISNWRRSQS